MLVTIDLPESVDRVAAFGAAERNLKMVRETLGVNVAARASSVRLEGDRDAVNAARLVVSRLIESASRRRTLSRQQVLDIITDAANSDGSDAQTILADGTPDIQHTGNAPPGWSDRLDVYAAGRRIIPRSENQQAYLASIETDDLVICSGPAGTGKTYLAVAAAIHLLKIGRVKKAILARPAVEAGEKLGFLPGDQFAKVNPYLRPLLDALNDMMDYATMKRFMAADVIEVVPLAYMRGRTLNDAVIILDEAQNTTRGQMQMFLTRMGQRSKMIVTGDPSQIDLPDPRESGLIDAARRLRRTRGVSLCALQRADVVRHPLVQRIIDAYGDEQARTPVSEDASDEPWWTDPEQVTDPKNDTHSSEGQRDA